MIGAMRAVAAWVGVSASSIVLVGCHNWSEPPSPPAAHPAPEARREAYRRPYEIPFPAANPYSLASWELGRRLFFDVQLSGARDVSCASCHDPARSWGDGRATARGTGGQHVPRRTPTVLNAAWATLLFWDGRAETLEEQALGPVQAEIEMNLPLHVLEQRLRVDATYRSLFEKAFAEEPTAQGAARALATFQRTVVSGRAPFDAWIEGDERAISEEAKRGFVVFNTKGNCAACHSGWRFTDDSFHDIGVATADRGRGAVLVFPAVQFAFKTPTLRNVVERAPYMHNGTEATLEEVIELYDRGGRVRRPSLSAEIRPLELTATERRALLAFLRTLSSDDAPVAGTRIVRSTND